MANLELYGASTCPFTDELREHLRWRRVAFTEYDVEQDRAARSRLETLAGHQLAVPVLVEDGRVKEVGWHGRMCFLGPG